MADTSRRREQVADAAIETLAAVGMRGLTHRAVDRAAGLPEGSTSYYFRTRQSLLQAVLDRVAALDVADAAELSIGDGSLEAIAAAIASLVRHLVTKERSRTLARYEVATESVRQPDLREVLLAVAERVWQPAVELLGKDGSPRQRRDARLVVACLDGLIFTHLVGTNELDLDPAELRDTVLRLLRAFIGRP